MSLAGESVRARVYLFDKESGWADKGTGFCTLEDCQGELHLNVSSESEFNHLILDLVVHQGEVYELQKPTLIVWTEPTGEDIALSFEDTSGCLSILEQITELMNAAKENAPGQSPPPKPEFKLPRPSLRALYEIDRVIDENSRSACQRDKLVKAITSSGYLEELQHVHETCEDLGATEDLYAIYSIARRIILLNDSSIFEAITRDQNIVGIAGMLEYDLQRPVEPGTYRGFLRDRSNFREVFRIQDDEIRAKIHQTFRLQFLRDTALSQIVDEGTIPVINTLIHLNYAQIVDHIYRDKELLGELLGAVQSERPADAKRDAVLFAREFCSMARCLPVEYRMGLFYTLSERGLFSIIAYALPQHDRALCAAGADMLRIVLDQDRMLVRLYILGQCQSPHEEIPLLRVLVRGIRTATDSDLQNTFREVLRVLLDPSLPLTSALNNPYEVDNNRRIKKNMDEFLDMFYSSYAEDLMSPLLSITHMDLERMRTSDRRVGMLMALCDMLTTLVRSHGYRAKCFVLSSGVAKGVFLLFDARPSQLQLAALRFIRTCVANHDDMYSKYLISHSAFGMVVDALIATLPRDNLVASACRELLVFVAGHCRASLLPHILGAYSKALENSPATLKMLQQAYDDYLARLEQPENGGMATPIVGAGRRSAVPINMLVGHERSNGGGRKPGPPGGALGGPWGIAMIDESEDAFLETLDEAGDSAHAPKHPPELANLQSCLDTYSTNDKSTAQASTSSSLDSEPSTQGLFPSLKRSSPTDSTDAWDDTATPKSTANDAANTNGAMSMTDAFPESRRLCRKLERRVVGGRLDGKSKIKVSLASSPRRRSGSSENGSSSSNQSRRNGSMHRSTLAANEPSFKRQHPASIGPGEVAVFDGSRQNRATPSPSGSPTRADKCSPPLDTRPQDTAKRDTTPLCTYGQSPTASSAKCHMPPKKARTSSTSS
ncbi:Platinum sensitivity protein [Coemansia sp. RSA 552]|nr:Platinum sensitivity protein [Coemansia sp. RSA 552]